MKMMKTVCFGESIFFFIQSPKVHLFIVGDISMYEVHTTLKGQNHIGSNCSMVNGLTDQNAEVQRR